MSAVILYQLAPTSNQWIQVIDCWSVLVGITTFLYSLTVTALESLGGLELKDINRDKIISCVNAWVDQRNDISLSPRLQLFESLSRKRVSRDFTHSLRFVDCLELLPC